MDRSSSPVVDRGCGRLQVSQSAMPVVPALARHERRAAKRIVQRIVACLDARLELVADGGAPRCRFRRRIFLAGVGGPSRELVRRRAGDFTAGGGIMKFPPHTLLSTG